MTSDSPTAEIPAAPPPNSGQGLPKRVYVREPHGDPRHSRPCRREHYRMTVAYDGTDFYGWQKQEPKGEEPKRTVQGVLEATLRTFLRDPQITLHGASRTDSGVHAMGQCAAFMAATPIPVERMAHAVSSRLPDDIRVLSCEIAPPNFNVIGGAKTKQYRYRFHTGEHRPLFNRRVVYHTGYVLNVEAMKQGAALSPGGKELAADTTAGHGRESTIREIHDCQIETPPGYPNEVHVVISGSGFLYNTVRIIAGTLLEIGRGHFPPEQVTVAFEKKDRHYSGPTMPAVGLCLEWIKY